MVDLSEYTIFDGPIEIPDAKNNIDLPSIKGGDKYDPLYIKYGEQYDVDPAYLKRQGFAESGFNPTAKSPKGALGLAQFMPPTWKQYGNGDPFDPERAIEAQAKYNADLLSQFDGDYLLAAAAYNAGPERVKRAGGVPKIKETQEYVGKIFGGGFRASSSPTNGAPTKRGRGGMPIYSDLSEFTIYEWPQAEVEQPEAEKPFLASGGAIGDIRNAAIRGVSKIPGDVVSGVQTLGGLGDATIGQKLHEAGYETPISDALSDALGFVKEKATEPFEQFVEEKAQYSPETQASQAQLQQDLETAGQQEGIGNQIWESGKAVIANPRASLVNVGESVVEFIGLGQALKALGLGVDSFKALSSKYGEQAAADMVRKQALRQAVGLNALMEGAGGYDEAESKIKNAPIEQLRQSPEFQQLEQRYGEAKAREVHARDVASVAGAISGTLGGLATRVAGGGVEGAIASRMAGVQNRAGSYAGRVLANVASETAEETGQGIGGQFAQNIATHETLGTPYTEGLASAAGSGAAFGLLGGATAGPITSIGGEQEKKKTIPGENQWRKPSAKDTKFDDVRRPTWTQPTYAKKPDRFKKPAFEDKKSFPIVPYEWQEDELGRRAEQESARPETPPGEMGESGTGGAIVAKSGNPFKTKSAASAAIRRQKLEGYEVRQVDEKNTDAGFYLAPVQQAPNEVAEPVQATPDDNQSAALQGKAETPTVQAEQGSFQPTHETSEGEPIREIEPGLYINAQGEEIEDDNATQLPGQRANVQEEGRDVVSEAQSRSPGKRPAAPASEGEVAGGREGRPQVEKHQQNRREYFKLNEDMKPLTIQRIEIENNSTNANGYGSYLKYKEFEYDGARYFAVEKRDPAVRGSQFELYDAHDNRVLSYHKKDGRRVSIEKNVKPSSLAKFVSQIRSDLSTGNKQPIDSFWLEAIGPSIQHKSVSKRKTKEGRLPETDGIASKEESVVAELTEKKGAMEGTIPLITKDAGANVTYTGKRNSALDRAIDNYKAQIPAGSITPNDLADIIEETGAFTKQSREDVKALRELAKPTQDAENAEEVRHDEAEGQEKVERRKDIARRKRVDEMTPEEMRKELFTDDLTRLGNKRAWNEIKRKKYTASIDTDGLKWINDNLGHETGDEFLKRVGEAFHNNLGDDAFHVSGDEFMAHGDDAKSLEAAILKAQQELESAVLEYTAQDGTIYRKTGLGFSYGIGQNTKEAEAGLKVDKDRREAAGYRSSRGAEPSGVVKIPAERREAGHKEVGKRKSNASDSLADSLSKLFTTGSTVEDITKLLNGYGKRVRARLAERKIVVLQHSRELPKDGELVRFESAIDDEIKRLMEPRTLAAYDPLTDVIYLIADYLHSGNLKGVLRHEAFHRTMAVDKRLAKQRDALMNRLDRLMKHGKGAFYDRARKRIKVADIEPQHVLEEFGAYTVEEYENAPRDMPALIRKWVEDFKAFVRMVLFRFGFPRADITPADLAALARMGLMAHDSGPMNPSGQRQSTRYSRQYTPEQEDALKDADNVPSSAPKAFKEKAADAAKKAIHYLDSLGPLQDLPGQQDYLKRRYLTLGKIARIDETVKEIYDALKDAGDDQPNVFKFLTTKEASSRIIKNDAVRKEAIRVKNIITEVGQKLVDRGLLNAATYEANKGAYLPRIYLRHLLDDKAIVALGNGRKPSDLGYLKKRKDIPEDVRRLMLGEITDPGFLASRGYGQQMRDIALLDWIEEISENKDWVLQQSLTEWRGNKVTPYWLKAEANQIRAQAIHYTEENKDEALDIANQMDEIANKSLEEVQADHAPDGFMDIPDSPRYGSLRGLIVRKEIYDDIVGTARIHAGDESIAEQILGYGGAATKFTQLWKWAKVAANPPAQIRNFISNGILLHLSGVPFHKVPLRVVQAFKEIKDNGKYWQVAKKYGVTESTFSAQELYRIERELLDLDARNANKVSLATLHNMAGKVMDFTGDIYQKSEAIFKTAKIIDEMEKGSSESNAALEAQKWMFDYSLVTPSMRYLRNAPIGIPFLTFYMKALPRMLEVATKHPLRLAPYIAVPYALTAMVASMADVDDDDVDKLRLALPKWLQERGHAYILPAKDEGGRWQAIDFGYFLPWTMWTELAKEMAKGDIGNAMMTSGLLGGPVPDMVSAVKTNIDPFTKKQIVNENDPPSKQIASIMAYLYNLSSPTWLTRHGFAGHMYNAVNKTVDKYGDPKTNEFQAALRLVGVNMYPINPVRTRAENINRMKYEIVALKRRRTMLLRDKNLDAAERKNIATEYAEMIKDKRKEMIKYANESRVHPNLR